MFMICLHIEHHMPISSSSLISGIKLNAKENFCMATIFLFYILQKTGLKKDCVSLKVCYYASFQDPRLNDSTFAPTPKVCMSSMLLLLIAGH
jgi:hypothetical protein